MLKRPLVARQAVMGGQAAPSSQHTMVFHPAGQLNSAAHLPLLKEMRGENTMEKDSRVEIKTGSSLTSYRHRPQLREICIIYCLLLTG